MEQAHGIGAAAHAGHQHVRIAAEGLVALALCFLADHGVEIAHQHRVGMGTRHRTEDVVGALHVGHPVADRFAGGVLEGGGAGGDGAHRCPQQAHAEYVEGLTAHVLGAHVDDALQPEAGADGGGGHAVLTGTGFGNDPLFAHAQGQQRLPEGVVDLVGAGVVEVFALQPDARAALGPAVVLREPLGFIEGIGPPHIGAQQVVEPVGEGRIGPGLSRGLLQLRQGGNQGFRHVLAAELAVATQAVGAGSQAPGMPGRRRWLRRWEGRCLSPVAEQYQLSVRRGHGQGRKEVRELTGLPKLTGG